MKSVLEIVNKSTEFLKERGLKNPRKEAIDIVGMCLNLRPMDLYMQFDRPLHEGELDLCRAALKRRGRGEPLQYIKGEVEFYGCVFAVNKDVLIPRQETEILVDLIAKDLKEEPLKNKTLWDLCCGSGCIGIALKKTYPFLDVVLTDVSLPALEVAKANARRNKIDVEALLGNFLLPMQGRMVDVLVCNPPYVAPKEFDALEIEVRGFEPRLALVAEEDGLAFYRQLAQNVHTCLRPGGKLWLEIGHTQGKAICDLFLPLKPKKYQLLKDWSGLDRFFFLEIE